MNLHRILSATLLAACCMVAPAAWADLTVSGVKYEEGVDVRGTRTVLNGAGVRYKGPFKVYAAGLYVGKKADTPEALLSQPGAKRISVTMLRDIDASELGKLFVRGVEDNMTDKAALSKLIPGLMRMSEIFSQHKNLKTGENFHVDWIPGTGTIVYVRGVPQGEPFKEAEFFNALLRIWIGPVPADWRLKDALLGKPA